ncbi:MAG: WD40/YVTN/BNR-like repeat-containing protein, partial [Casimicrobiaceae bacterium]
MKSIIAIIMLAGTSVLAGCGGGGSSAAPPAGVTAEPGDTSVIVNWVNDGSVEYWVWVAQGSNVSTDDCATMTGCRIYTNVRPPFIVAGLLNGTTYSVTVNGRHDGGPGGSGSPTLVFVPRLAGATWDVGVPLTGNDMLGVGYTSALSTGLAGLATVGAAGTIFTTGDVTTWTAATSGTTANLNAVQFRNGLFVAIGDEGTILTSPDSVTWTPRTSPTTNSLAALDGNGSGQVVAVGAQGTILVSDNSTGWSTHDSHTTANLY